MIISMMDYYSIRICCIITDQIVSEAGEHVATID
jgi:hypothetical protein